MQAVECVRIHRRSAVVALQPSPTPAPVRAFSSQRAGVGLPNRRASVDRAGFGGRDATLTASGWGRKFWLVLEAGLEQRGSRLAGPQRIEVSNDVEDLFIRQMHIRHRSVRLDQHTLDVLGALALLIRDARERRRAYLRSTVFARTN